MIEFLFDRGRMSKKCLDKNAVDMTTPFAVNILQYDLVPQQLHTSLGGGAREERSHLGNNATRWTNRSKSDCSVIRATRKSHAC